MASSSSPPSRFQLSFEPIDLSLTKGTNIPAPPESPPESPRPPTPGRGPLSSHPTSPNGVPGALPPTPGTAEANHPLEPTHTNTTNPQSTLSPATSPKPMSPTLKRPRSVRKFLGLRIGSSDSLNTSHVSAPQVNSAHGVGQSHGLDAHYRPQSPAASSLASRPSLSRKKSGSWFGSRRKSGFFGMGKTEGETPIHETPAGNGVNSVTSAPQPAPVKKGPPPPTLPALKSLGVSNVDMGAEDLFKDIGKGDNIVESTNGTQERKISQKWEPFK